MFWSLMNRPILAKIFPMVHERIRKFRRDKNLTQRELGEKIGIDQKNISAYESGKLKPSKKTLSKFAEALEVSVESLTRTVVDEANLGSQDPELLMLFNDIVSLPETDRGKLKWMLQLAVRQLRIESVMKAS
jgi:transcriptional regulator with XRE-family HTH domain